MTLLLEFTINTKNVNTQNEFRHVPSTSLTISQAGFMQWLWFSKWHCKRNCVEIKLDCTNTPRLSARKPTQHYCISFPGVGIHFLIRLNNWRSESSPMSAIHWNSIVVILAKFLSLSAQKVAKWFTFEDQCQLKWLMIAAILMTCITLLIRVCEWR